MAAVRELFGNRVISRFGDILWPPRSPDLSVCDFFLWGYLKNRVYTTRPRTLDELKQRIQGHWMNWNKESKDTGWIETKNPRTLDELKQRIQGHWMNWNKESKYTGWIETKIPRRNSCYPSWDVAAGNGEPQRQIERMHTYRRKPSTGRNFQTLIIWITVSKKASCNGSIFVNENILLHFFNFC